MEQIGIITYTTLDSLVDEEVKGRSWEVLAVYQNDSRRTGIGIKTIPQPQLKLPNLRRIVNRTVQKIFTPFVPLFGEFRLKELIGEILCDLTFFEQKEYYDKMCYTKIESSGVNFPDSKRFNDTITIQAGSHLRLGPKDKPLTRILLHEYGHQLHDFSCQEGISLYDYYNNGTYSYDNIMMEIFGIMTGNLQSKRKYQDDPHLTADMILNHFEINSQNHSSLFHENWKYFLQFTSHQDLAKEISYPFLKKEETTNQP